jgi:hypothetical protein
MAKDRYGREVLDRELYPAYLDAVKRNLQNQFKPPAKMKTVKFDVLTNGGIVYFAYGEPRNGIYFDKYGVYGLIDKPPAKNYTGKTVSVKVADPITNPRSLSVNPHEHKYIVEALKRAKTIAEKAMRK